MERQKSIPGKYDRKYGKKIGNLLISSLWNWSRSNPHRIKFFLKICFYFLIASIRRIYMRVRIRGRIPAVLAISPTMRCNYDCIGCYSRDRTYNNELTTEEFDSILTEAEQLGISTVVITGGEPFIRSDTLNLMEKHKRLLFVTITNGSLVSFESAKRISENGNMITLVSIEGFISDTDFRRNEGAHEVAIRTFDRLRQAEAFFGFAATNTTANIENLASDEFVDQMVANGCAVGFFTEYIPCGPDPRFDWVLNESQRENFRKWVLEIRNKKPIIIVQFPHDEYGKDNICSAAGKASFHINSQGDVEPCPFIPISRENIRKGGLVGACKSPFLRAIREHSELLQRKNFACSLFEHFEEIKNLSSQFDGNSKREEE
jgi:MoaA/NifB/PqqE/SkfB family radical SAM enzyme